LTTARLMTMRDQLPTVAQKGLRRVVSSGERMQRMIDQILDVTRAKLSAGIPIHASARLDLAALVSKIVDEIRAAHPERTIEFRSEGACEARADGDRLEQVVSNLLGNAVTHGDPQRPISVALTARSGVISLAVHNHGDAISPEFMPLLFDPFKRSGKPQGRSDGLGLGLFISHCIVTAHGGRIEVESSPAGGTRFEVILPTS
jgi:signal transduction histidine kinase